MNESQLNQDMRTSLQTVTSRRRWLRRIGLCGLLSGVAAAGLSTLGWLESPGSLSAADPLPLPAAAIPPLQQPPAVQPFSRASAAHSPAAPAQPWVQSNPGVAPRGLVPPTGIQQAVFEQPAPGGAAAFEVPGAGKPIPRLEIPRPVLEGADPFANGPAAAPAPAIPRGAPAGDLLPALANPESLPHVGADPFAALQQGPAPSAGQRPAAPPLLQNGGPGVENPSLLQQPIQSPVRQPAPVPPGNLFADDPRNYSPTPAPNGPGHAAPLRPVPVRAMQPLEPDPDARMMPAGGMDLTLPGLDPVAPALPLANSGAGQPLAQPKQDDVHEVKSGENYWTISRQYYGSARFFSSLAEYNRHRIADPNKMRPGMYVLVPDIEILHQRYPKLTGGGPEAEAARVAANRPGFFLDQNSRPAYRVAKGDTLTEIAQKHLGRSTGWTEIYRLNRAQIPDPNNLKLGTVLQLPAEASQVSIAPELLAR